MLRSSDIYAQTAITLNKNERDEQRRTLGGVGFAEVKEIYYLPKLKDVVQNQSFHLTITSRKKNKKQSRERKNQFTYMYMEEVSYTDSHCRQSEKKMKKLKWFFFLFFLFSCSKKVGWQRLSQHAFPHMLADVCACTQTVHLHVHKTSFQHFNKRSKMPGRLTSKRQYSRYQAQENNAPFFFFFFFFWNIVCCQMQERSYFTFLLSFSHPADYYTEEILSRQWE